MLLHGHGTTHTLRKKNNVYTSATSGGPWLTCNAAIWNTIHSGKISLEKIVEKMCINPAKIISVKKSGFNQGRLILQI